MYPARTPAQWPKATVCAPRPRETPQRRKLGWRPPAAAGGRRGRRKSSRSNAPVRPSYERGLSKVPPRPGCGAKARPGAGKGRSPGSFQGARPRKQKDRRGGRRHSPRTPPHRLAGHGGRHPAEPTRPSHRGSPPHDPVPPSPSPQPCIVSVSPAAFEDLRTRRLRR